MLEKLKLICDFLKQNPPTLSQDLADGRINSSFNEHEIIDYISGNFTSFKIQKAQSREWYDFSFDSDGVFAPVNIKVSTTNTADNLNCKLGIYYCLTGKCPPFNNGVDWDRYFELLSQNLIKNDKDYYFLVINKNDPTDVFATSLKSLQSLQPNGNNLPFQARWDKNKTLVLRDYDEAKDFILNNFAKSIKARVGAFDSFFRLFNQYYKNA